ncbi:MAG: hypothetical protein QXR12_07095, partial [Thermofilum sp.]
MEGEKDYWRARHQDLVIWATAEKHNAAILTRDSDFEKLWEKFGKLTVYHIAGREKPLSAKRLGQLACPSVEDALVKLGIRIELDRETIRGLREHAKPNLVIKVRTGAPIPAGAERASEDEWRAECTTGAGPLDRARWAAPEIIRDTKTCAYIIRNLGRFL